MVCARSTAGDPATARASIVPTIVSVTLASLVVVACVLAPPGGAAAQERDYAETIREALAEFDVGHFEESLALFRVAHALRPSARTLRGLGNCSFELRHYVDAVGYYQASLASTENPLTPEQRAEVEGLLGRARVFVGTYHLVVTPPEATVTVDGRAATSRELLLDIGDHSVSVAAPGRETRTVPVTVRGAEDETLTIELGAGAGGAAGGGAVGGGSPVLAVGGVAMPAEVHVRVESRPPGLVLHAMPTDGSRASFAPVCAAPCEATLRGGTYEAGVSVGAGEARASMGGRLTLDHDATLALEYESAEGLRVAGGVTFGLGLVLGLALVIVPFAAGLDADTTTALLLTGGLLIPVAAIVGLILALNEDHIAVREVGAGVRF